MAACWKHVRLCARDLHKLKTFAPLKTNTWIDTKRLHTSIRSHSFLCQFRSNSRHHLNRPAVVCVLPITRGKSTTAAENAAPPSTTGYIPEPPPLPQAPELVDTLNALGEPTIQSLGLGGWTPSGMVQQGLDFLHVGLDLPWWGAIMIGTVCLRMLVFPLVIKSQQNAALMHNHAPVMTRLQVRMTDARASGDAIALQRATVEYLAYMQKNGIKMFKSMLVPFAQLPVFVSVFFGLRGMANLPVESMKLGGLYWFTDLTVPDPFYALPIVTAATFLLIVQVGVDGVRADMMSPFMRYGMRAMPFIMLPFISNFPAALLTYWCTTNAFSLLQVLFLRIPAVRTKFGIEQMVKHEVSAMPKKKGFVQGFKEAMDNAGRASQFEERQRLDAVRFKKAGEGPMVKTYSYNPTKIQTIKPSKISNVNKTVQAKPK
ncbi:mitochondrial inner membrane protein OXA1L-like [Haliotis rufescens]|uniref:mitochondrial inner membrane protein OXA1L-like n=1 Tax=Haliotis rufescens TaxID=6454 RepID=UPI001EAFE14E|nr:mitochondrial inner membrane protein OXA1L-like [Haliotis rufescens]